MTPKQRVAVLTGVLAALGVGVSVGIIAAGGGFSGSSILNPPTAKDIWEVGNHIQNGTTLDYTVTAIAEQSSLNSAQVSMSFKDIGKDWSIKLVVTNGTEPAVEKTVILSKQLTKEGQLDNSTRMYFEPVQSSVLAVRDMGYNDNTTPKYLVIGAPWDTIFVASSSITVRVTGKETVQTQTGSFDSFVLSYKLLDKTSKIWVVRDLPLPVKAEVYDAADNLQYKYELVKMSGISSSASHS